MDPSRSWHRSAVMAVAAVAFLLGGAALAGFVGAGAPWLGPALVGFALGAAAGFAAGAAGAREAAFAGEPGSGVEARVYEPTGSTCPTCRRPLLPGMTRCPFCNPTVPAESALEQTVHREYDADRSPVALPGVAAARKVMLESGALGFLHVFDGPGKGQSILLAASSVRIGRAADNHLILNDGSVSQHHAEVRPYGRGFTVHDAGSKNGTFVNDQRVQVKPLQSGDVLGIGTARLLVQLR